jgi:HEAT repeat protein
MDGGVPQPITRGRRGTSPLGGVVASAIPCFGPAARDALPGLEKLLPGSVHERVRAAMAIWRIDGRTAALAPVVMEGLGIDGLGWEAADCLREMGPDAGIAADLAGLLSGQTSPSWRAQAALALGGTGLEAVPAIPALVDAADDPDEDVAGCAFDALRELRTLARTGQLILWAFNGGMD